MKMMQKNERVMADFPRETSAEPIAFLAHSGRASNSAELALICAELRDQQIDTPPPLDSWQRAVHVTLAIAAIIFLAPVFLIVALLVALTDPGPVLYRQKRVGLNGKQFDCLKFRTMRTDADSKLAELLDKDPELRREWKETRKLDNDPRITPIGKLLRLSSLDELPQLFNVLSGDINLVGPRPIIEDELPCYGRYLRHYLSVRPGLTGMWQISGRSSTTYRRRVAADVLYVRRRSPALDLYIILATIPAVVLARGAV